VTDSYCLVGTVEAGLRKCRLDRFSDMFRRLQSVMNAAARLVYGPRHSEHVSDALISLHWLRAQERVGPRFMTWNRTVRHESSGSCRRSDWSTFPPLCSDQSSAGTVRDTVYRRLPGLPGRRTHHLEQPAAQHDICPVSVNLPSAFNKKLSYRRGTARCVVSVEILPIATLIAVGL